MDLTNKREERLVTPWGAPSDAVICGGLPGVDDVELLFLPRHGRGHRFTPTHVNYRANVAALKKLGATHLLSVSAVGSMREDIAPGDLVVVDQFIDMTKHRVSTFFSEPGAPVVHVGFAEPVCALFAARVYEAAKETPARIHKDGTYLCIEGPQFSSRAESLLYRSWGVSVIGMTNATEAKLAREAELPFATLALSTDYDCWHQEHESVTVDAVIAVLQANVKNAQQVIASVAKNLFDPRQSKAHGALKNAMMTAPEVTNKALVDLYREFLPIP
jgi:5'-methylthioadenosine phosphorylase